MRFGLRKSNGLKPFKATPTAINSNNSSEKNTTNGIKQKDLIGKTNKR